MAVMEIKDSIISFPDFTLAKSRSYMRDNSQFDITVCGINLLLALGKGYHSLFLQTNPTSIECAFDTFLQKWDSTCFKAV